MQYLSEALKVNKSLQILKIKQNNISDKGMQYLSEALKVNKSLQEIYLNNKSIGNESIKQL